MHTLKLYGYWRSSAAYRVRIALGRKGLDYDYVPVHLLRGGGEQRTSSYRQLNPGARVPTLEVDGQPIYQSVAILEWLEEQYPDPPLLPADPLLRARARGISQMIVADIQPLQNLSVTQYLEGVAGWDKEELAAWLRHWITRGLSTVETALESLDGERFAFGEAPTMVEACLIPQCYAARRFGVDPASYPNITRIERLCSEIPAFQRAAPERQPDAEPPQA